MFMLVYNNGTSSRVYRTNDIKDLADIIVGENQDEPLLYEKIKNIASWMNWSDKFSSKNYTFRCYNEKEDRSWGT